MTDPIAKCLDILGTELRKEIDTRDELIAELRENVKRCEVALSDMPCACPGESGVNCPKCGYFVAKLGSDVG